MEQGEPPPNLPEVWECPPQHQGRGVGRITPARQQGVTQWSRLRRRPRGSRLSRESGNPGIDVPPTINAHPNRLVVSLPTHGRFECRGERRGASPLCRGRGGVPHNITGGWVGRITPARQQGVTQWSRLRRRPRGSRHSRESGNPGIDAPPTINAHPNRVSGEPADSWPALGGHVPASGVRAPPSCSAYAAPAGSSIGSSLVC